MSSPREASRGRGTKQPNLAGKGGQNNRGDRTARDQQQEDINDVPYVPEGALEEENQLIDIEISVYQEAETSPVAANPRPKDATRIQDCKKKNWPDYQEEFF